jgi:signal transduction histidine kinase
VIGLALVVALATLAAGLAAGLLLGRLPTLRFQLAGLALAAALIPLSAVVLSGLVMFKSGHDIAILVVAAAASSTAAVAAALLVVRRVAERVGPLRHATAALAAGDLSARAPEQPPRELAALARDFNEMARRLEELFDARSQLVAWASHDLRTPLASIQAMLEALEDGLAAPDDYLPVLRDQTGTLARLVDDLFELARIDAGVLTLELHEARLSGLVDGCLRGLAAQASRRGIRLEAEVDEAISVLCAPEQLERVLFNLLTNALRHTPSDGSVAVRAAPVADEVRVTVEDTGDGLRGGARPERGGAGLGLTIARGLVEAHGGRIWAENRPGGGARVSFTLRAA